MQHRTRVKICGITNRSDALCAIEQGVDALGFVFCNRSPRNISISVANEIIKDLPPFVTTVALFMDEPASFVNKVIDSVPFMTLQFHGQEDETYCQQFSLPYIKSVAMGSENNLNKIKKHYASSQALLLDSNEIGKIGGSGKTFDWTQKVEGLNNGFVLAGGLTPDNVGDAIRALNPYAVDVSSGVEKQKGRKDHQLIKTFMKKVHQVNYDN